MHELYELKDMLCQKLEEYSKKGEITANSLEVVDKLAHAVKNLGKIIEMKEEEDDGYSSAGGMSYARRRYSRENRGGGGGGSYARGRGANRGRDGRYSRAGGDTVEEVAMTLGEMMGELPEELKGEAERFMRKLNSMM